MGSITTFLDLPKDVLALITSYLPLGSICRISETCIVLRDRIYAAVVHVSVDDNGNRRRIGLAAVLDFLSRFSSLRYLNLYLRGDQTQDIIPSDFQIPLPRTLKFLGLHNTFTFDSIMRHAELPLSQSPSSTAPAIDTLTALRNLEGIVITLDKIQETPFADNLPIRSLSANLGNVASFMAPLQYGCLQDLQLCGKAPPIEFWEALRSCSSLSRLSLRLHIFPTTACDALSLLPTTLETLSISSFTPIYNYKFLAHLPPRLTSLSSPGPSAGMDCSLCSLPNSLESLQILRHNFCSSSWKFLPRNLKSIVLADENNDDMASHEAMANEATNLPPTLTHLKAVLSCSTFLLNIPFASHLRTLQLILRIFIADSSPLSADEKSSSPAESDPNINKCFQLSSFFVAMSSLVALKALSIQLKYVRHSATKTTSILPLLRQLDCQLEDLAIWGWKGAEVEKLGFWSIKSVEKLSRLTNDDVHSEIHLLEESYLRSMNRYLVELSLPNAQLPSSKLFQHLPPYLRQLELRVLDVELKDFLLLSKDLQSLRITCSASVPEKPVVLHGTRELLCSILFPETIIYKAILIVHNTMEQAEVRNREAEVIRMAQQKAGRSLLESNFETLRKDILEPQRRAYLFTVEYGCLNAY